MFNILFFVFFFWLLLTSWDLKAERAGFGPRKTFRGLNGFQGGHLKHLGISPKTRHRFPKTGAKYEKNRISKRFSAQIYSFCLTYTQYLVDKF